MKAWIDIYLYMWPLSCSTYTYISYAFKIFSSKPVMSSRVTIF